MNIFTKILGKIINRLLVVREMYMFNMSKKHVTKWGVTSYGYPNIINYDRASKLSVGDYVSIASNVSILLGANHKRGLITNYPHSKIDNSKRGIDTNERGDVTIGNDVWLGYGATIIGPVNIGDGAIVGAGALVISDVPAYAVVGGVPAKVLKYRFSESQIAELLKIKWWNWKREDIENKSADLYHKDIDGFIQKYSDKNGN